MSAYELDAVDYVNVEKNQWRMRAWNILQHGISDGVVLYLAASLDMDRRLALRHGVKPYNLIAVENNIVVAKELRKRGVNVIVGDILDVAISWQYEKHKVDAILCDLQCPLTDKVADRVSKALMACPYDAQILVNLQRGREGWNGYELFREMQTRPMNSTPTGMTNRFRILLQMACERFVFQIAKDIPVETREQQLSAATYFHCLYRPVQLDSYKSSKVVMDSGIFCAHGKTGRPVKKKALLDNAATGLELDLRSSIAAALNIRTRQMRGDIKVAR